MLKHEKQIQKNKLDNLLRNYELSVASDSIHLIKGQAAESINRVVGMIQADIILMCTVGRTGIPGLFIGNTAEEVLQSTNTSILAIKPAGFASPVK